LTLSTIPWQHRIDPYPRQQQAIFDPPGNAVILASPKAGKTIAALQWLIEEAAAKGGNHRRFLWVAPNYGQAKIAFRRAYQEVLDLEEINLHKTDHTVTLPDTSVIFFGSADKPDSIFGEDYHGIVVDEATRCSLESWIAITSTTQHTGARYRLIGNNTRRPNWAKKLAVRARKGELPGWEYHKLERADAIAAGVIDQATADATRLLIPEDEWQILYEGADADDGRMRLDTYKLERRPVPDVVLRCRSWDLASTTGGDFTVGTKWAASSEGFWVENIVRDRRSADDVPDWVAETAAADGPRVEHVFEEEKGASGKLTVSLMRRLLDEIPSAGAVWPAPVEQSKMLRAMPMCSEVKRGRVFLAPDFHHSEALAEMEDWPDAANDDVIDAMAHGFNFLVDKVSGLVGSVGVRT
jgi:predicted phage terminase large subunit-like protein